MDKRTEPNAIEKVWQVWLTTFPDTPESSTGSEVDRASINFVKIFADSAECEQFLRSLPNNDRAVVIVDDSFSQQIIPRIHELEQVFAIYVHRAERGPIEAWLTQFSKFRGIRTQTRRSTDTSRTRSNRRSRREADDQLLFNVFNNDVNHDSSTAELDGQFVHSQLLIDCLQRMKSTSKEIEEFVQFCRDHQDCKGSQVYLELLEEFQKEYSSEKSLWWYTRDSFVYRMLNKALRLHNIDILFLFRFFIRDLEQQLKENQWLSPGSAYRGQALSKDELKRLQQSVGKLISVNSFLSTSLYRDVAAIYVGGSSDLEKALFKISFNPFIDGIKPFADITLLSDFPQEGEILFMLGSIFQIQDVYCAEDDIWIIQLNLCSDHDQGLKPIFHFLRKESSRCEFDLLAFGNLLNDMGRFEAAKSYYNRCLKLLPAHDYAYKAYCYYLLGVVASQNGEEKDALKLLHKSLLMRKGILQNSDPSLADTLGAIARVHYINCDLERALDLYQKALGIFHQAFGEDDLTSAMTYTNIGVVSNAQAKYAEALDFHWKAFQIRCRHLPPNHFRFGTSYNNLGEVHYGREEYDEALKYYKMAQEVYKNSLPSRHIDNAILLVNIGRVHEIKTGLQEALVLYKAALGICRAIWPTENPHLVQIERIIESAEKDNELHLCKSLATHWIDMFRPFKCIASHDPRTSYREAHQSYRKSDKRKLQNAT